MIFRATLLVVLCGSAATSQGPSTFSSDFDRADREAQTVVEHLKCYIDLAATVKHDSVALHRFMANDVICALLGGRMLGAIVATDSTWKHVTDLIMIDPVKRVQIAPSVDTTELLTLIRAERYAKWLDAGAGDSTEAFPTVVYRADTTIRVWIIPPTIMPRRPGTATTGGERLYVFPRDAKKELYAVPAPARRDIKGLVNGEWIIDSRSDSIPTFSELLLANMLFMNRDPVSIVMPTRIAKLVGPPGMGMWVFFPNKKPDL